MADCLCADYYPATLIVRVPLARSGRYHSAEAVRLVIATQPVRLAHDRGRIAVGRRADLVAVKPSGGLPQAERVWVAGGVLSLA